MKLLSLLPNSAIEHLLQLSLLTSPISSRSDITCLLTSCLPLTSNKAAQSHHDLLEFIEEPENMKQSTQPTKTKPKIIIYTIVILL